MPSVIRLTHKQFIELIDKVEADGGDALQLRQALGDTNGSLRIAQSQQPSDEDFVQTKMGEAEAQHGSELVCAICHGKSDILLAGACWDCFRAWALSYKPKK